MKRPDASRAVRGLRDEAADATRAMPQPDIDGVLDAATRDVEPEVGFGFVRWRDLPVIPAIAAAAAIAVVVFGLLVVSSAGDGTTDPPEQLVLFVDSLYDDGSYVIDEIAARWSPTGSQTGSPENYLDGVWNDVLDDLAAP